MIATAVPTRAASHRRAGELLRGAGVFDTGIWALSVCRQGHAHAADPRLRPAAGSAPPSAASRTARACGLSSRRTAAAADGTADRCTRRPGSAPTQPRRDRRPTPPRPAPASLAQLVGFTMNPGRSTATRTSRNCNGIPSSIRGNGSVTRSQRRRVPIHEDRRTHDHQAEVERPRHRRHHDRQAERRAAVGPRHVHAPAADVERQRPGARARDHAARSASAPCTSRPPRPPPRTAPRPPAAPAAPRGSRTVTRRSSSSASVRVSRRWNGELPPAAGLSTPALKPGAKRPDAPADTPRATSTHHPRIEAGRSRSRPSRPPAPRRQLRRRRIGARTPADSPAPPAAPRRTPAAPTRTAAAAGRRTSPSPGPLNGSHLDPPRQLHDQPRPSRHQVHRQQRVERVVVRPGEVDRPCQRLVQQRRDDRQRPDARPVRARRVLNRIQPHLRRRATRQPVRRRRIHAHAQRQPHDRAPQVGLADRVRVLALRQRHVES